MKQILAKGRRVLAVYPSSEGLGFALFQDENTALDWGIKTAVNNDNQIYLRKFIDLINFYEPDTVIIRDISASKTPSERIGRLIVLMGRAARAHEVYPYYYSRNQILKRFERYGAKTKADIARIIGEHLPELTFYQPPVRKCWESENVRMSIFDAAALALTHFYRKKSKE